MKNRTNKFSVGDQVKCIVPTTYGPALQPSDDTYTVTSIRGGYLYFKELPNSGGAVQREFEKVPVTKEELGKALIKLEETFQKEHAKLTAKLAYLVATGNTEFNGTEFKVWNVLQSLTTETDDVSKAKMIANIIDD